MVPEEQMRQWFLEDAAMHAERERRQRNIDDLLQRLRTPGADKPAQVPADFDFEDWRTFEKTWRELGGKPWSRGADSRPGSKASQRSKRRLGYRHLYTPPEIVRNEMAEWLRLQNKPDEEMMRLYEARRNRKSALDAPLPFEEKQGIALSKEDCQNDTEVEDEDDGGRQQESFRQILTSRDALTFKREVPSARLPDQAFQIGGGRWNLEDTHEPRSRIPLQAGDLPPTHEEREAQSSPRATFLPAVVEESSAIGPLEEIDKIAAQKETGKDLQEIPSKPGSPDAFFDTQDIKKALINPATPAIALRTPIADKDPTRVKSRAQCALLSRSNARSPALPRPSTHIEVRHAPLRSSHYQRIESIVEDYEAGHKYASVDGAKYLDRLPRVQKAEKRRAATSLAKPVRAARWHVRGPLSDGRLTRADTGRLSCVPTNRRTTVRKRHRLAALGAPAQASATSDMQAVTSGSLPKRTPAASSEDQAWASRDSQSRVNITTLGVQEGDRPPRQVVTNALTVATAPLKSTRPDLGRTCFVFDGAIDEELYGYSADEETYYVAYTGHRPATPDVERLLRRAVDPPGMLTPQLANKRKPDTVKTTTSSSIDVMSDVLL